MLPSHSVLGINPIMQEITPPTHCPECQTPIVAFTNAFTGFIAKNA
jgi:hypothetical protein